MQIRLMAIVPLLLWTVGSVWAASPKVIQMEVEDNHVANWNRFALNIYNLHLKQIAAKETRQTVTSGEYGGFAAEGIFYMKPVTTTRTPVCCSAGYGLTGTSPKYGIAWRHSFTMGRGALPVTMRRFICRGRRTRQ